MMHMAQVAVQSKRAFICLIKDFDTFDLGDRRVIKYIVEELYKDQPELIEAALVGFSAETIDALLRKYSNREKVTIVGSYLRMFTTSSQLAKGWLEMERVELLLRMVLDDDYTIVADAIETARVSS